MASHLAIDSNLLLLLIVGRAEQGLIARHKRLRSFTEDDYDLLRGYLFPVTTVLTTPNALTEVANLAPFGMFEPQRSRVLASLKAFILAVEEAYSPSTEIVMRSEFERLRLTDCAWLTLLAKGNRLLTVDNDLYLAALDQGYEAVNFDHVRASLRRA